MSANLENSAVVTGLEKVSFHSNPKEGQCQRMFKLPHNCIHLVAQTVKVSAYNAGNPGSIPGLGRSPGEGKGYPLQYSGLENSMDCIVYGVTKSQTQLSDFHFLAFEMSAIIW